MDLVRLALERASTAVDAVHVITTLLERHGQGGSGHEGVDRPYWSSFLVADPRAAFVVDTSGPRLAVERVDRARATSNRTTIASFDRVHRHPRQPVDKLVDPRLSASNDILDARPVSVDTWRHICVPTSGATRATRCACTYPKSRRRERRSSPSSSPTDPLGCGPRKGRPASTSTRSW